MVIMDESHGDSNDKCLVSCKAHEKPCDHMVIAHESRVVTRGHVHTVCKKCDFGYSCRMLGHTEHDSGFFAVYVQIFQHASTRNSCWVK